jgi:TolB-like protein/Tfp pilus assembly protein PilF
MQGEPLAFGPFVLSPEVGTLLRDGVPVPVSHRGMLLLGALAKQPGKILTKSELMEAAWPGQAVEEGNLTVQIAALRKLLGEAPNGAEWIATVPRVGYRFVDEIDRQAGAVPSTTALPAKPSLAVLPFDSFGRDSEQEYFADGVVEDIITALSRFKSFAVIARNSSFTYKGRAVDVRQVARELGVRYVLEGSIRRAADRLRVTAQLIDGVSGAHLWADRFDGGVEAVFDVQDRITESVATIVEPQIREAEIASSRRERPGSLAAYDLYLQALPLHRAGTQKENAAAYALLSKAIAIEPGNAVFLAWTLDTLLHRTIMGWPMLTADDRALVREYVHRALFDAHDDAAVLGRCANALIQVTREYELGLATLQRALKSNPNSVEVMTFAGIGYLHCGDPADALTSFRGALRLSPADPYAFIMHTGIAHVHMIRGEYAEARAAAEQSMTVSTGFDPTYWMLIAANAQLGRMDEAQPYLEKYRALVPGITLARIRAAQPPDPTRMGAILEGLRLAGLPES